VKVALSIVMIVLGLNILRLIPKTGPAGNHRLLPNPPGGNKMEINGPLGQNLDLYA
jgi:hypothetical protein